MYFFVTVFLGQKKGVFCMGVTVLHMFYETLI